MSRDISKYDNIIDSRDVIKRIAELTEEVQDGLDKYKAGLEPARDAVPESSDEDNKEGEGEDIGLEDTTFIRDNELTFVAAGVREEAEELAELLDLQSQAEGYCDWRHGCTLINDDYFKEYAQEFAEDIGAINHDATWPNTCIDWEQAAEELQMDYTSVDFGGETFYVL